MASRNNGEENLRYEAPDLEIVGDQVTIHPSGYTSSTAAQKDGEDIEERKLVRNMARFRENPIEFLKELSLFVSGTGWRAYENPIGQPVFYSGFSEKIKTDLRNHYMVKKKISELAKIQVGKEAKEGLLPYKPRSHHDSKLERQHEIESHLREVTETMMDSMICKMESIKFIRGAYYLVTQLLTRAYDNGTSDPFPPKLMSFVADS
ncbi:hypothetical protein KEM55_005157 [Ascosphaera atra]|nr:hypothetical protein KEM55_005157 [Ascosphaera atra]